MNHREHKDYYNILLDELYDSKSIVWFDTFTNNIAFESLGFEG